MTKWIVSMIIINPLTAIWILFYIAQFLKEEWYLFPAILTMILFLIAAAMYNFYAFKHVQEKYFK